MSISARLALMPDDDFGEPDDALLQPHDIYAAERELWWAVLQLAVEDARGVGRNKGVCSADGLITPMPEAAIFADTRAEPTSVYRWLDRLELMLPFPVVRVSHGDLGADAALVVRSRNDRDYVKATIPAFVKTVDGRSGPMIRGCTRDYKIRPIEKEIRRRRNGRPVIQWIGISLDEVVRMKPARTKWITNRWPLVELRISRSDCQRWLDKRGLKYENGEVVVVPRSACSFCPFHTDLEWKRLRDHEPEAFASAVTFEGKLQAAFLKTRRLDGSLPFLHKSGEPLAQIAFDSPQTSFTWDAECEGICGV